MSILDFKRLESVLAVTGYAASSGTAAAVPTPGVEFPKQIVLTASDILMYTTIWKIYFQEDLSRKQLIEMLAEVGMVTIAAVGTAYVVVKGSTALLHEITDWFGPVGWGVAAIVTGSLTGIFGAAWMLYCDRLYTQNTPILSVTSQGKLTSVLPT